MIKEVSKDMFWIAFGCSMIVVFSAFMHYEKLLCTTWVISTVLFIVAIVGVIWESKKKSFNISWMHLVQSLMILYILIRYWDKVNRLVDWGF